MTIINPNVLTEQANSTKDEKLGIIRTRLKAVDWTFPGRGKFTGIHDFHWYPARFIPQIPAYLIDSLSKKGDLVLDPFCGTGSTQIESLLLMRKSLGVDAQPLAVMISKSKTAILPKATFEELQTSLRLELAISLSYLNNLDVSGTKTCNLELKKSEMVKLDFEQDNFDWNNKYFLRAAQYLAVPEIFLKDKWYHPKTLLELAAIKKAIAALNEIDENVSDFKNLCLVAFSSILKKCSSQKNHYSYVADNMIPKFLQYEPAMKYFWGQIAKYNLALQQLGVELRQVYGSISRLKELIQTQVGDARKLTFVGNETIDCIVTSPPYQGAIDTSTAHRLSTYWLGFDLASLKNTEIGARWRRSRADAFQEYSNDMILIFREMNRVLKPGGTVALVLGKPSARIRPMEITSLVYEQLVGQLHFTEICPPIIRQTVPERKSVKSIQEDIIVVLSKS